MIKWRPKSQWTTFTWMFTVAFNLIFNVYLMKAKAKRKMMEKGTMKEENREEKKAFLFKKHAGCLRGIYPALIYPNVQQLERIIWMVVNGNARMNLTKWKFIWT